MLALDQPSNKRCTRVGQVQNDQLYMTVAEQRNALLAAGFSDVQKVAAVGSMVMHRAT
jgi:hypothetical protein